MMSSDSALVLPPRFNTAREPAVQPGARRSQQGWKMVAPLREEILLSASIVALHECAN